MGNTFAQQTTADVDTRPQLRMAWVGFIALLLVGPRLVDYYVDWL